MPVGEAWGREPLRARVEQIAGRTRHIYHALKGRKADVNCVNSARDFVMEVSAQ